MPSSTDAIRDWLKALGALVAAAFSQAEAQARLDAFVPLLAEEYPNANRYFSRHSLRYVAAKCLYFPTFGELCAHLNAWSKEAKPDVLSIGDDCGLSERDRHWLAHWHRRERENFAPLREPDGRLSRPDVTDWREHEMSLLRAYAPAAANHAGSRRPA